MAWCRGVGRAGVRARAREPDGRWAAAVLAAALVIYALVVEPVWGWWYMRRLRQRVRVDDEARVDGYRLIIATEWTLAGCALLAYTLSDLAPHEVFLVLLVVAALLLPAVQVWVLALGVAVVFGLAHVYQGAAGVVVTSMMGAVLGVLVVATGSLLPAVVLHAALDLRALLIAPRTASPADS